LQWYTGSTIVDLLDEIDLTDKLSELQMRMPISGVYKVKGLGNVLVGTLEQGRLMQGQDVKFLPSDSNGNPCKGKLSIIEMYGSKKRLVPTPGCNIGVTILGLPKDNMPKTGDVMVNINDTTIRSSDQLICNIKVVNDYTRLIKVGYELIANVRTKQFIAKIINIKWKTNRSADGIITKNPSFITRSDVAEIMITMDELVVAEQNLRYNGLSRIALFDGLDLVMFGNITEVCQKFDSSLIYI